MLYCKATCYRYLFWRNTLGQAPCGHGRNFWAEQKPTVHLWTRIIIHGNVSYNPTFLVWRQNKGWTQCEGHNMQQTYSFKSKLRSRAATQRTVSISLFSPSKVTASWDSTLLAGQSRVQILAQARDFLFSKTIRTERIWSTQLHIQRVPTFFPGGKAARVWSWPHPFSAVVMNEWSDTSTPLICLHGMGTGNSTLFYLLLNPLMPTTTTVVVPHR